MKRIICSAMYDCALVDSRPVIHFTDEDIQTLEIMLDSETVTEAMTQDELSLQRQIIAAYREQAETETHRFVGIDKGSPDGDCTVRGHREGRNYVIDSVDYTPAAEAENKRLRSALASILLHFDRPIVGQIARLALEATAHGNNTD